MSRTRVIVNDEDLEGVASQVISYSKKGADVGDPTLRTFNFSRTFNAPFNPTNNRILQNSNNPNSSTSFPYTVQDVKLIEDGIEIFPTGQLVVRRCAGFYELYVMAGAAGFYEAIKGKKLNDLDLSALTQGWDADAMMNETTGVVFPVIDYGNNAFDGSAMDGDMNLPSVYYHTLINQIITDAGYSPTGSVFSRSKFLKTIMPFSRSTFSYDGAYVQQFEFSALVNTNQVLVNPALNTKINFLEVVKTNAFFAASRYTHADSVTMYADFYAELTYTFSGGVGFDIQIRKNGATVLATVSGGLAGGTLVLDSRTLFPDGVVLQDTEYVEVVTTLTTGTITVTAGKFYDRAYTKAVTNGALGDTAFGKMLPDMLQTDLFKDFMVRFNLLLNEDGAELEVKSLNDIISDTTSAMDWTTKRVKRAEDDLSFAPLNYAQNNYFKYSVNDDRVNEAQGRGNLEIANVNAPESRDIYTSPFNNTLTELVGEVLVARIPIYEDSTDRLTFDNDPGLRLLLVRDKYSFEPTINGETSYKVAYFEDATQEFSMSLQQSLDDDYPLQAAALQKAKVVRHLYILTRQDFRKVNFMQMVFDKDSLYIINDIPSFVAGRKTEVELFKVS